jgi:hypothetical protein
MENHPEAAMQTIYLADWSFPLVANDADELFAFHCEETRVRLALDDLAMGEMPVFDWMADRPDGAGSVQT